MKRLTSLFIVLCIGLGLSAQGLERVTPEQVGLSSERLLNADAILNNAVAAGDIPGAVLAVVRGGKLGYLKAYGNRRTEPTTEKMTVGTVFDMASCSKSMSTAICMMILADRGLVRMLDPVSYYIEGFQDWTDESGEKMTIRIQHLMTHTSGLPAYGPTQQLAEQYGAVCPAGLLEYIKSCPRQYRPETDMVYSCLNFITLQHIIEQVSGMSLRDFARQNIFQPLGMSRTDYLPCHPDKKGRWTTDKDVLTGINPADIAPTEKEANGQILCGQVHDPLARIMNGGISGNAGVFSCAEDVAVLCAALQNGGTWQGRRILSPQAVRAMRTVPRIALPFGRTLGWDVYSAYASNSGDLLSPSTYGHTGFTGTSIVIDPDNDLSIILLINAVHPTGGRGVVRLRSVVANAVAGALVPEATTPYHAHYYKRFLQFMDEEPIRNDEIVMLGNSLTEGADWGKLLGRTDIRNRGIVGDELMGIYRRLHQILPHHPRVICLQSGANDVSHDLSTDSILSLYELVIRRILSESPQTRLIVQSLLPINEEFNRYQRLAGKTEQFPQINTGLEALCRRLGVTFVNLFPHFAAPGSHVLRPELSTDGLHLRPDAYRIWAKQLKPVLDEATAHAPADNKR